MLSTVSLHPALLALSPLSLLFLTRLVPVETSDSSEPGGQGQSKDTSTSINVTNQKTTRFTLSLFWVATYIAGSTYQTALHGIHHSLMKEADKCLGMDEARNNKFLHFS